MSDGFSDELRGAARSAWGQFIDGVEPHRGALARFCRRLTGEVWEGEDLAHRYLRRKGYVVVARNYRTPSLTGEADLVAWDGDALVFVEVKSRKSAEFGEPERAVDVEKRERIVRAALDYTRRAQVPWDCVRFDVIGIVFEPEYRIALNRAAFVAR